MKNAISWFEIPTQDINRAKQFYEAIFDFQLQEFNLNDNLKMMLFPTEQGAVGGALVENHEFYQPSHEGALLYLNANPDVQNVLDKVEDAGGKILTPKTQISEEIGYMAIIEDSEGNRVALMSNPV